MKQVNLAREVSSHANGKPRFVANSDQTVFLMRSRFRAFEGALAPSRHIRIALNVGETSSLYRRSASGTLDTVWRRNGIVMAMPDDPGEGRSAAVSVIGVAIEPGILAPDRSLSTGTIEQLSDRITADAVAATQIRELFQNAELHGCSSAFFFEQINDLTKRLDNTDVIGGDSKVAALDERRLSAVVELIEANLANDLSVPDMATVVQMDATHFAKAFRRANGLPPFAFLTQRRIEHAKSLLLSGMSVTNAALAVNYANPGKFAAAFRRCVGQTPIRWLNSQK